MSDEFTFPLNKDFLSDLPAEDDIFERGEFASRLADTIVKRHQEEPLTVSIVGSWGSGKSTVLKLMAKELNSRTAQEGTCMFVDFNPWRYSGQDTLIYHLFEAIVKTIDPDFKVLTHWQNLKRSASKARRWISASSGMAAQVIAPGSGLITSGLINAVLPDEFKAHVDEIKEQTAKHLRKSKLRLVVLLDDVDRLEAEEILLLFRSLKLVADLPNTTFVIAMDEGHVSQVIGKQLDGKSETGRKYLEKIINVRLSLPVIPPEVLEEYALETFSKVWQNMRGDVSPEEADRVRGIFHSLHGPYLRTPRTVKSIANAFHFSLGLLKDELNPGDVLLLEATRLLHPRLYEKIQEVIPTLTSIGNSQLYINKDKNDKAREHGRTILIACISDILETRKEDVGDALKMWFPQLGDYHRYNAEESQKLQLLNSLEYFWRYFSLGIHKNDVQDAVVRQWIRFSYSDPENAIAELSEHLKKNYAAVLVRKIESFCDETWERRRPVVLCMIRANQCVLEVEKPSGLNFSYFHYTLAIAGKWLSEVSEENRSVAAVELLQQSSNLEWNLGLYLRLLGDKDVIWRDDENRPTCPFNHTLAYQSIESYEKGDIPKGNEKIFNQVSVLLSNRHLEGIIERLQTLVNENSHLILHMLVAGCGLGMSRKHQAACWNWRGKESLAIVEILVPRSMLEAHLLDVLGQKRPKNFTSAENGHNYYTLEEVGWLCLDTIKEAKAEEALNQSATS